MGTNRINYPHLLQSTSLTNTYGSVNNSCPTHIESGVMEGLSIEGKISSSRRIFILLTVFDVLFTFLLWIIHAMVSGQFTTIQAFKNEVINYRIQTSMFDIVVLALARLFFIVLFYVFIKLSHWWVVALTTTGSGVFIIAKVFVYQWTVVPNKTASVVLLLCSFILSWTEAWFLEFRVNTNETKALAFLAKQDIERVPIIPHPVLSRSQSDDGSAFYSPPDSDSEVEGRDHDGSTVSEVEWLSPKNSNESASKPS